MAVALKLNEHHAEVAQRYFNLAITNNFIQGRRSEHVVACCLYIVCRIERTTHMLIDFSELLQVMGAILWSLFMSAGLHRADAPTFLSVVVTWNIAERFQVGRYISSPHKTIESDSSIGRSITLHLSIRYHAGLW